MNNTLTNLLQQLGGIWKQLGLNQRVSLVLTTFTVVAGTSALIFWSGRPDFALLYGRLDEAEAAKVIAALDEAKVPYTLGRAGGTISVPADKVHLMRMQLAAKGIPRGDGVGFEIFDKPNFGISDFVQRANYTRAVQGELARTIAQVDNIESARVMVVLPENRLLSDLQRKPTASVFVRVRAQATLPQPTVNAIRFLVANAVEGLNAQHVSVVDNLGNVLSEHHESDTVAGLTATQLSARKNFEQYLARKAERMLDAVLGPGQAVVRVATEINFDSLQRTEEKFDPEGQVLRTSTLTDENTDATLPATQGGAPGTAANAASDTNATSTVTAGRNNTKKKVNNVQYEINKSTSTLTQTAGGLRRLSVAVFIAARMTGTGTNRLAQPRPPEEMLKLKRLVQSAVGIQENAEPARRDEITVEEMAFNDQPQQEVARQSQVHEQREFWWGIVRQTLLPTLAVVAFLIFWRAWQRTPTENIPIGIPLGDLAYNGNGHSPANGNGNGHHHDDLPPVVTVEVLNQLVRENPGNMTQAIRHWMTRGTTPKTK